MRDRHHELRNALATALMTVQVARDHPAVLPEATELLDTLERHLLRIAELIDVPHERPGDGQDSGGA